MTADEVDLVLAQGQYMAIVYMIQQNFSELDVVMPVIWPLPTYVQGLVSDDLYRFPHNVAAEGKFRAVNSSVFSSSEGVNSMFGSSSCNSDNSSSDSRTYGKRRNTAVPTKRTEGLGGRGEGGGGGQESGRGGGREAHNPSVSRVVGSSCVNPIAPIFSTVPINIAVGRILLVENPPDYYLRIAALQQETNDKSSVNSATNKNNGSSSSSSTSSSSSSSSNKSSSSNSIGNMVVKNSLDIVKLVMQSPEAIDGIPDTVPTWEHLRLLRVPGFSSKGELTGTPLVELLFLHLFVDFNRRHNGGGNGIQVRVGSITVNAMQTVSPLAHSSSSFAQNKNNASQRRHNSNNDSKNNSKNSGRNIGSLRVNSSNNKRHMDTRETRETRVPDKVRFDIDDKVLKPSSRKPDSESQKDSVENESSKSSGKEKDVEDIGDSSVGRVGSRRRDGMKKRGAAGGKGSDHLTSSMMSDSSYNPNPFIASVIAPRSVQDSVNTVRDSQGNPVPQLTYLQEDIGNLRRCIVQLSNTAVVGFIPIILSTIAFFLEPITLASARSTALFAQTNQGPFDFKRAMDVEVHAANCTACIPEVNDEDGPRALCFDLNFDYTQVRPQY